MATSQSQSFNGGSISPGASIEADDLKNLVVNRENDVGIQQQEIYEPLVGKVFNIGRAHIKVNGTEIGSYDPLDTEKNINIDVPAAQVQSDWDEADDTKPDYIKNKPDLGLKADKVHGATAGNLASLDANGNLADSGKKTADFKTKQTAVSVTGGSLKGVASMSQNANGEVTLTLNDIQDGTTAQKGVVRLNNAIDSTSTTEAATPKAVKDAYDDLNNKIVARAIFLSQAEWAVQSQIPGDPAKVYYVENGTGEDAYTVYVWKDSTSEYVEVDESSIDLDGYWHDTPNTTGTGNVVTDITLGNDGVPQVVKGINAITQHQSVTDNNPTLAWSTRSKVGTIGGTDLHVTMPSNPASGKQDTISDLADIRSGAAAGASALQPSGNGSNLSVTPDGTSTGYDLGSSTTLKAFAQKFKNLVGALKALAFKDKVSTGDISDDAITADKVKDNETLPVNIAGSAQTLPRCRAYFTGSESGYKNLAILEPPDPASDRQLVLEVLVNQAGGGGSTFKGILSVGIRNDGGTYTYGASYIGRNTSPISLYVRYSRNSHRILIFAGKSSSSSSYCSLTLISRGVTSFDGRLIDSGVTLYDNPALEDMSGYPDVPISNTLCPDMDGRLTLAPFGGVGSPSTPVYVDSDGQVEQCTPSQMSVGSAATASKATSDNNGNVFVNDSSARSGYLFQHDANLNTGGTKLGYVEYPSSGRCSVVIMVTFTLNTQSLPITAFCNIAIFNDSVVAAKATYLNGNYAESPLNFYYSIDPQTKRVYVYLSVNSPTLSSLTPRISVEVYHNNSCRFVPTYESINSTSGLTLVQSECVAYNPSKGNPVGSTSAPVYVDADGQVKPCKFQVNFGTPIAGANVLNIITA